MWLHWPESRKCTGKFCLFIYNIFWFLSDWTLYCRSWLDWLKAYQPCTRKSIFCLLKSKLVSYWTCYSGHGLLSWEREMNPCCILYKMMKDTLSLYSTCLTELSSMLDSMLMYIIPNFIANGCDVVDLLFVTLRKGMLGVLPSCLDRHS